MAARAPRLALQKGEHELVSTLAAQCLRSGAGAMISSLVWLLVGIAVMAGSAKLRLGGLHAPGPGFLPMLTGALMALLGLISFVQDWYTRAGRSTSDRRAWKEWVPVLKALGGIRYTTVSTWVYLAMGWLILIAAKTVWTLVPSWGIFWLLAGGIAYTAGAVFFMAERIRYFHFVWHLFVVAGTACHFVAVLWYAV